MKLPTPKEMASLEQRTHEAAGITVAALMERAGARTAEVARRLLEGRGGRRVVVLAGKGNNGGDGLVAARDLVGDARVTVLLAGPDAELGGGPAAHLPSVRGRHIPVLEATTAQSSDIDAQLRDCDLIIDALFGTGFHGPAQGVPAALIEAANRSGVPILAVDVPSGIDSATGAAEPPVIRAAATVTMGLPKLGLVQFPAAACAGRLFVADIGIPRAVVDEGPIRAELMRAAWIDRAFPRRRADGHKGTYGHVYIVAGARGFTGAAVLAARGAIRGGAGLVTVALPRSLVTAPTASLPEAMTLPLPETDAGSLGAEAEGVIREAVASVDGRHPAVVAIGPGLTTRAEVVGVVRRLIPQLGGPLVADADALNALAGNPALLREAPGPVVITPHPGELARLVGASIAEIQRDRVAAARAAASSTGAVTILKGARTVVASPDGRTGIIPNGNGAMGTGGTGDVLTGVVAAFLAQRLPAWEAAVCAAYLHGLAGDLAAPGELGLLSHEVADAVPRALALVRAGTVDEGITHVG
ncbi:MAG TPA: NAD(P)H-hydrate dehydratase [bacterium]|nr:NAD(P)H-hydrate dehydratase [bacterium]